MAAHYVWRVEDQDVWSKFHSMDFNNDAQNVTHAMHGVEPTGSCSRASRQVQCQPLLSDAGTWDPEQFPGRTQHGRRHEFRLHAARTTFISHDDNSSMMN